MKELYGIIKSPIVTEKSTDLKEKKNQIVFEVDRRANKIEIRQAIEKLFKVKVTDVRTINFLGKTRRVGRHIGKKPDWKKAIVTLKEGDSIDFFEGA